MHNRSYISLTISILLTLKVTSSNGFATLPGDLDNQKRCVMERTHKMAGYNCANLNLKEIPQNLKSSIQIFDLSFNRIRDLTTQSFARYTDVKYLYLFENMIQSIEKDTFAELTSLEALDLSSNALRTIPMELFHLGTLRNLYVASNNLVDLQRDLDTLDKPIHAPLKIINMADCRLYSIPNFGILPDLWHINISSNPLTDITVQQFSPMCNLKTIDVNNTQMSMCSCQRLTANFVTKKISIENNGQFCDVRYLEEQYKCLNSNNTDLTLDSSEYFECQSLRESRRKNTKAKTTWYSIAAVVLAIILTFAGSLFYLHRRNQKIVKKNQMSVKPITVLVQNNETRDKLINDCD